MLNLLTVTDELRGIMSKTCNMAHCVIVCTNFMRSLCACARVLRRCVPLRLFFKTLSQLTLLNGGALYLLEWRCPVSARRTKHLKKIRTLYFWSCKIWQRGSLNWGIGIGVAQEKFLCERGFSSWYKYGKIGYLSIVEHSENSLGLLLGGKFMDKSAVPWFIRLLRTILYIVTCSLLNSACVCSIAIRIFFFHWTLCLPCPFSMYPLHYVFKSPVVVHVVPLNRLNEVGMCWDI
jgi:hypothetical protein